AIPGLLFHPSIFCRLFSFGMWGQQSDRDAQTSSSSSSGRMVRCHLFTCEIDGQEVKTVDDCVAKLKNLDAKGRLWHQEMIMEVQGPYLLLNDIETKTELDLVPLSCIVQIKAVLDSCDFNSLLAITVQERSKRNRQCFMFQCEETGADLIKSDLDKAVQRGGGNLDQHREPPDVR
uniref:PTB domain-containing protein n=1 Tax=Maylandia zebra TaxID=106582 RepID=A0A3P9BHE5_9CICH